MSLIDIFVYTLLTTVKINFLFFNNEIFSFYLAFFLIRNSLLKTWLVNDIEYFMFISGANLKKHIHIYFVLLNVNFIMFFVLLTLLKLTDYSFFTKSLYILNAISLMSYIVVFSILKNPIFKDMIIRKFFQTILFLVLSSFVFLSSNYLLFSFCIFCILYFVITMRINPTFNFYDFNK